MSAPGTILVGYDGSSDSEAAVHWAARLSVATGKRLRIVHAVGLLEHAGLGSRTTPHREAAVRVATAAGALLADVEWSVVVGDPCSALLRITDAPDSTVQLVVVGSRGSSAHGGSLLGSTSLEVAEHSSVPVTVVPADYASVAAYRRRESGRAGQN